MTKITYVRAFQDNYIWLIVHEGHVCVVDPGEAKPVIDFVQSQNLVLDAVLITHHHNDHVGGVKGIVDFFSHVQANPVDVYGPKNPKLTFVNKPVTHGDKIKLFDFLEVSVFGTPGHTLDHLVYYSQVKVLTDNYDQSPFVFTGDTLFLLGSGKLFEGDSKIMFQSLEIFKQMSKNTLVFCAHEYTLNNSAWALEVDPQNFGLKELIAKYESKRSKGLPTVPDTLDSQLSYNPFLRLSDPVIIKATQLYSGSSCDEPQKVLNVLRQWKNYFR
ncbi:hydroxyacylglutathione hydrolase [Taylorella equigenitalis]|uniref:hydroxyacylglutathione hydrolase n=1 Tax=Taylorella equigenitalis TaxID=29575 RepID=UPI000410E541|nr:hydroxyacylglutathione hydrolase [Taylorella equigenitalis]WDU46185.1 hydroxyacylglutathione hydrolase [Taylorella equigenitalis]